MNTNELDALIHDCIEGRLSEADAAKLSALLEQSAEARARYWETASVHGLLENSLQQASLRVITGQAAPDSDRVVRLFQWRPWAAAAAGIVFGILSASMVWAYALPLGGRTLERAVALFTEGFEDANMPTRRGFPSEANRWTGDFSAPTASEDDVAPSEGSLMLRLNPVATRKFGYAWHIVDLEDHPELAQGGTRRLEVSAAFNTPEPGRPLRYQIRLAAFSQEPTEVRQIWNNEPVLFDTVLQHVGRNVLTKPDQRGWQTVQAALELPPGTRSVVISLAAGEADADHPLAHHYLDDVQARIVMTQPPVE